MLVLRCKWTQTFSIWQNLTAQFSYWTLQIYGGIGDALQRREWKWSLQLVPLPKLCTYLEMEMRELILLSSALYNLAILPFFFLNYINLFITFYCSHLCKCVDLDHGKFDYIGFITLYHMGTSSHCMLRIPFRNSTKMMYCQFIFGSVARYPKLCPFLVQPLDLRVKVLNGWDAFNSLLTLKPLLFITKL